MGGRGQEYKQNSSFTVHHYQQAPEKFIANETLRDEVQHLFDRVKPFY